MVLAYSNLDLYFHMSNHYKKIQKAKSVIDCSTPKGFCDNPCSKPIRSSPHCTNKREYFLDYCELVVECMKQKRACRQQRITSAPLLTQCKSWDTQRKGGRSKSVEPTSKSKINKKSATPGEKLKLSPQSQNSLKNSPKKIEEPIEDKTSNNQVEDHEYFHFLLAITEDILRNNLYTNSCMDKVFHSHMEANKDRLDEQKMIEKIDSLKKGLNYPLADSTIDKSQRVAAAEALYLCLCGEDGPEALCKCNSKIEQIACFKDPNENVCYLMEQEKEKVNEMMSYKAEFDSVASDPSNIPQVSEKTDKDEDKQKCASTSVCFEIENSNTRMKSVLKPDKSHVNSQSSGVKIALNPEEITSHRSNDNSIYKIVNKGVNNEITSQLVFYRDDGECCRCTFALRKTVLKIQLDDTSNDEEYVLVDGPVCMPRKMLENKTVHVLIENVSDSDMEISRRKHKKDDHCSNVNYFGGSDATNISNMEKSEIYVGDYDLTPKREETNDFAPTQDKTENAVTLEITKNDEENPPIISNWKSQAPTDGIDNKMENTKEITIKPEAKEIGDAKTESASIKDSESEFWRGYYALLRDASTSISDLEIPSVVVSEELQYEYKKPSASSIELAIIDDKYRVSSNSEQLMEKSQVQPVQSNKREASTPKDKSNPLRIFQYSTQNKKDSNPIKTNPASRKPPTPNNYAPLDDYLSRSVLMSSHQPSTTFSNEPKLKMNTESSEIDPPILAKLDEIPTPDKGETKDTVQSVTEKLKEFRKIDSSFEGSLFRKHIEYDHSEMYEIRQTEDTEKGENCDQNSKSRRHRLCMGRKSKKS